jgi:putative SOS response-associated peptidase YedK
VPEEWEPQGSDVDLPQEPEAVYFSRGLWDFWLDRDTGSQFYTLTIITTRANGMVRRLHDRMPMIYDPPRAGSG